MLEIHLRKTSSRTWRAYTYIEGRRYAIGANEGASNRLARILKAQGISDQPFTLFNPTGSEAFTYPSLYRWASFDYQTEKAKYDENCRRLRSDPPTPRARINK